MRQHKRLAAVLPAMMIAVLLPLAGAGAADEHPSAADVARTIDDECSATSEEILDGFIAMGGGRETVTVRHRGDFTFQAPENSIAAFENSYVACRAAIETDVRRTQDGELVMFHDTHIGKMLEPTYNPEANSGPNARLDSMTLAQLKQKNLVRVDRVATDQKIVTFEEFLDHYFEVGGRSLLFVEIKEAAATKEGNREEVLDIVRAMSKYAHDRGTDEVFDRVVLKFRMSTFPTVDDWLRASAGVVDRDGVDVFSQVMVSAQIALKLEADESVPGGKGSRAERATESWSKSHPRRDGVLSVEVTMKDATGAVEPKTVSADHGVFAGMSYGTMTYADAGRPGTMARLSKVVRDNNKPLGQFVPIPDWAMWRQGAIDWQRSLPNVVPGWEDSRITPKEAFFQNSSACCYALRDRVDSSSRVDPEQNDQRIILPFMVDIKATVLTADDTDSIDYYMRGRNLNLELSFNKARPQLNAPNPDMHSLIYPGSSSTPSNKDKIMPLMSMVSITRLEILGGTSSKVLRGEIYLGDFTSAPTRITDNSEIFWNGQVRTLASGQAIYDTGAISVWVWLEGGKAPRAPSVTHFDVRDGPLEDTVDVSLGNGQSLRLSYQISPMWQNIEFKEVRPPYSMPWRLGGAIYLDGAPPMGWVNAFGGVDGEYVSWQGGTASDFPFTIRTVSGMEFGLYSTLNANGIDVGFQKDFHRDDFNFWTPSSVAVNGFTLGYDMTADNYRRPESS